MSSNVWKKIIPSIREYFGSAIFDAWLSDIVTKDGDDVLTIYVKTNLAKDYIETKFLSQIIQYASMVNPCIKHIIVEVDSDLVEQNCKKEHIDKKDSIDFAADSFNSHVNSKFTFDNFVVGKPNKMAYEVAKSVAQQDKISANPFYLYGNVGLGKTHLMHAIYWESRKHNKDKKVIYMSAESFMFHFISGIKNKNSEVFKSNLRSVDVLMIDDMQFIADKDSTQNELAHTINTLLNANKQVIISADRIYSELNGFSDYLRSRFTGGLVVNIHPTTYELRLEIIKSKMQVKLPNEVVEFLAQKITSNVREIEGALQRIKSYMNYIDSDIDVHTVYTLLQDMIDRSPSAVLSVDIIIIKVAEYYKVGVDEIYSKSRLRKLVRVRQVAIYLAKKLLQLSMSAIAKAFKGRDVTTILYAINIIDKAKKEDYQIKKDIECLIQILKKK